MSFARAARRRAAREVARAAATTPAAQSVHRGDTPDRRSADVSFMQRNREEPDPAQCTLRRAVTLEDVRAVRPAMIYYGANTCWWTHRMEDVGRLPGTGLPCDPRGGMLFETNRPDEFLAAAEEHAEHYGAHGLDTFMAAHHGNVLGPEGQATCFRTWDQYNAVLDAAERRPAGEKESDGTAN